MAVLHVVVEVQNIHLEIDSLVVVVVVLLVVEMVVVPVRVM